MYFLLNFCHCVRNYGTYVLFFHDHSQNIVKVTGDSLLIHAFAYSLFLRLCSVTSNMTSYSISCHSIKLIHCGATQRDVLSDKMVL